MAGRIAIVTGGASGIGAALARALAADGDTVVVADRDAAGAERVADSLPPGSWSREVDVMSAEAVQDLVDDVVARHGRLDLMVNNAGIGVGGPVEELSLAEWDRVIDVNIRGVVHGVVAAYPQMVGQGSGHIVNTASLAGLIPTPFLAPYGMTKHAVVGLSLSLRAEAEPNGVRVTAVCPGPVETPILDGREEPGIVMHHMNRLGREYLTQFAPPYDVDALARDVVRGIDSNAALIVTPGSARLAWRLHRLSPALMLRIVRRQVTWARERLAGLAEAARPVVSSRD